jgi:hypothetical protein
MHYEATNCFVLQRFSRKYKTLRLPYTIPRHCLDARRETDRPLFPPKQKDLDTVLVMEQVAGFGVLLVLSTHVLTMSLQAC